MTKDRALDTFGSSIVASVKWYKNRLLARYATGWVRSPRLGCNGAHKFGRHRCLQMVTLGGHTHTTMTTFGAPVTVHVFDGSNCGSGVVRWCAHHLLIISSIWGRHGALGAIPPHPRDGRTLLGHLGGHTHTTTTTYFSVPDFVFDGSNCGSGVVRLCARHLQHLGSPWALEAMLPHPKDGRTLLGHLGRAQTHHHDHIPRSRLRIRRFELRFGCHTVVFTSSSASRVAMGHWGQWPLTPGITGHSLATLLDGPHSPHFTPLTPHLGRPRRCQVHCTQRIELQFGCTSR